MNRDPINECRSLLTRLPSTTLAPLTLLNPLTRSMTM